MLLALCLSAGLANAAVITQTQYIGEHVPSKSGNLTFGYFDESLGTLLSVEIVTTVSWWGATTRSTTIAMWRLQGKAVGE